MTGLFSKILRYKIFRILGYPKTLPLNLTLNVTYNCPSRCQTCNIWKKTAEELTLEEWEKVFQKIGRAPYWLILSGGEPFSRKDLPELARLAYIHMRPKIINIPTNGFLSDVIPQAVEKILKNCPKAQIVINFSLDGLGENHDAIRQLPGSFEKMLESYHTLRKIDNPRLTIGVHSVISKLNFKEIPRIYEFVKKDLRPDSYITEIAEKRVELQNRELEIFPEESQYQEAIDFLLSKMSRDKFRGFSRITQAFRVNYYELTKETIRRKTQVIPCYSGIASGQISAEGEIWPCCVRAVNMGSLRENDYDFKKIWLGKKAEEIRKSIRNKECHCPLASASYTNILMNQRSILKVISKILK